MGFRLEIPPSLGREVVRARARGFVASLHTLGFDTVVPAASYEELEQRLLTGESDAAWAPPLVCARIERAGGVVALRSLRWGATDYRSVIVSRQDDRLDLALPGRRRPRAVWVDPNSMAGYLLPRAHVRALGHDPTQLYAGETFHGSYLACLEAVLAGDADVTATFASVVQSPFVVHGFTRLLAARAGDLRVVAYTGTCPNDGIVVSPRIEASRAAAVHNSLLAALDAPAVLHEVATAFEVDGFDRPPKDAYRQLLDRVY